jgi:hypothetical protein
MGILWLHWENVSSDNRIWDYLTDVYFKGCIVIWEKQALSWRMHLLAVEDTVCGMRRTCWVSYRVTNQPTLVTFILQQDVFLREQHGVLCVRMGCIRFMYNQCKGCSRERTSFSLQLSGWELHKIVHTPQCLCSDEAWRKSVCHKSSGLRRYS